MNNETINSDLTISGESARALLMKRYRILRQLGQGGMGSVWLAEDILLDGKLFAIKMLPSILVSNKRAYNQLKAEALVSMKLVHQNIVALRAFEENGNNPFLVMDYIEGETLDDYLEARRHESGKRGMVDAQDEIVRILKPIAEALDYAHREGVVHRDVKPSNVIIRRDGHPFILDFGIAREIQETMTRVTGRMSSGTLMYMSPEQLNGESSKPAQDVYSFAAMAYECLSGDPPFCRGAIEDQIKNKSPEPLPSGVSIAPAVMAGLSKSPQERPASCVEILDAEFSKKRKRPSKRNSRKTGLAVLSCLAVFAAAGVAWWLNLGPKENVRTANAVDDDLKAGLSGEDREPSSVAPPPVVSAPVAPPEVSLKPEAPLAPDPAPQEEQAKPATAGPEKPKPERKDEASKGHDPEDGTGSPEEAKPASVPEERNEKPGMHETSDGSSPPVTAGPQGPGEDDVSEILAQAKAYKRRLDGIDGSDGFDADRESVFEMLKSAFGDANGGDWRSAAEKFTNCVEESKMILGLDAARSNAKISRARALSAKENAKNAAAEKYARREWNDAVGKMNNAEEIFRRRKFADSKESFDLAAGRYGEAAKKSESVREFLKRLEQEGFILDEENNSRPAGTRGFLPLRNGLRIEMVWCPPGCFMMGSKSNSDESAARHPVRITKGFWISKYEVTERQWAAAKGGGWGGERPQTDVSVEDCNWFCRQFPPKIRSVASF